MKPIIFSTPMVQAILGGRKTQTRRIVKANIVDRFVLDDSGNILGSYTEGMPEVYPTIDDAPYQEGDILWVRETWNYSPNGYYCYKADTIPDDNHGNIGSIPWRPSIHMPREAARLFLKVTSVKVERVQDITPKNIAAEGLPSFICHPEHEYYKNVCGDNWLGFEWFRELWDGINSKRGYGWDTNPWVWVVAFEKISKEEAERLEGLR